MSMADWKKTNKQTKNKSIQTNNSILTIIPHRRMCEMDDISKIFSIKAN